MNFIKTLVIKFFIILFIFFTDNFIFAQSSEILINEFLAANRTVIQDPDFGQYSDWLELYNNSQSDIDVGGYYLTDNLDFPAKWQFAVNTIVPAQGYLLVWADGEDTGLHTNFKISKAGEALALCDRDSAVIDSVHFGSQQDDISYGRLAEELSAWAYFGPPSPGSTNITANTVSITPEPIYSLEGGFYSGKQTVHFLNQNEVDIYYSLDGTAPDELSMPYTESIQIQSTTAVRAIAYQDGKPPSAVITNTYFIDIPVNLPVISLVTHPDNFFDEEIGIYITGVNGRGGYCAGVVSNVNQDWERPVNIELYEPDGEQGLNQQAGVKIFGGCSRHRYPQKSLSLYARSRYGKGSFRHKLFVEKDINRFESFILRSSADDQLYTMFRDAAGQSLLINTMDADYQAYRPAVVYLNGEYWGIHNIREKLNEHYIAGNFGIDPDEVNILANSGSDWNIAHGSNADYETMLDFVTTNDLAIQSRYELVKGMMDIDQYIDYMAGHIYLAERDWPGNNIKFWKANTGEYTRWRWINFDLDQTLTVHWISENMIHKTTTTTGPGWPNPEWSTRLFRNLLENQEFRNQFLSRYSWHISTTFDSNKVIGMIDSLADGIRDEIPHHIERWGGTLDPTGSAAESWIRPTFDSVELWEANVEQMRTFARQRRDYTIEHFINHFNLSGTSQVDINMNIPGSGILHILGKKIMSGFHGIFFNDVPVQISAIPLLGYTFSHWEAQSEEMMNIMIIDAGAEWKYHDQGANLQTDWIRPDYDDESWSSDFAQFGYGDGDETTIISYGGDSNNKHITTYFRKSFELSEADLASSVIRVLVDDGAVAYLNGIEIARVNMPEGDINYLTPAIEWIPDENAFHTFSVPTELLVAGKNVIAVEIHQSSATSSDISFDCSFSATLSSGSDVQFYDMPNLELAFGGDIILTAHFDQDTAQTHNQIVISEINYRSSDVHNTEDWLEIYNNSGTVIDLSGWKFTDSTNDSFLFPEAYFFEPKEYLVLCRNTGSFTQLNPSVNRVIGDFNFGLNSQGELIRIINNEGKTIDEVEYKVEAPWPTTAAGTGYTIELPDVSSENNAGENWVAHNLFGTPGMPYTLPVNISDMEENTPEEDALYANFPNPFNPSTTIRYSLKQTGYVDIHIFNITGQKVRTLISAQQNPGKYQFKWDGKNDTGIHMSSGVYFCRFRTDHHMEIRKLLLQH